MACDKWGTSITAYADQELPAEQAREFAAHLPSCPSCAAEMVSRLEWKRATQQAGKRYSPSAKFRQRIEQKYGTHRRATWLRGWVPAFAAAAIVLILMIGGAGWWRSYERQNAMGELADLHVATLASANPVDVVSTDRHMVKPWFAGKIPFTFNLPEFENTPFKLLGGRVTYFAQSPGAQLLVQVRQHRISVFIFQDSAGWARPILPGGTVTRKEEFNVESWDEAGLRYVVITDASPEDLRQLSEMFKKAARS
jgi:anti-sigma factor RsiW